MNKVLVVLALLAFFVAVIITFVLGEGVRNPVAWIAAGLALYTGSKLV